MLTYLECPKCGQVLPPGEQNADTACPSCGLILAKYGTPLVRRQPSDNTQLESSEKTSFLAIWLFHVPRQVAKINWIGRCVTFTVFSVWTIFIWHQAKIPAGEAGSVFLHTILLPFHEAGHYAIFRWFGEFIMILGGTLAQHLMPIVLGVALLYKRRDPFGAALFLWLLGFSIIDMAVYMYDAYDPKIMLLGGKTGAESDSHDWMNIFGQLGLINQARMIGSFFDWLGRAVMFLALVWAGIMLWLQKANLSDAPLAEMGDD